MQNIHSFMLFYFAIFFASLILYLYKAEISRLEALQQAATFAFNRETIACANPNFEFQGTKALVIDRKESGGIKNMPLEVHSIAENVAKERFLFIWRSDKPNTPYLKHLF
jgi:cbb3-type cytochrome oxidase subunit 3